MIGERDIRGTIVKAIDKIYDDLYEDSKNTNPDRIHALEACRCIRLSYYERKDRIDDSSPSKLSILLHDGFRHIFKNVKGSYESDSPAIDVTADMIVNEDYVIRFELIENLPENPRPRDLLYLNACLVIFNKFDGLLIYITSEGKTVEFSMTKNVRMFDELRRRAKVLTTLVKENKVPIVEPSDLCLGCKYYERCYAREKGRSGILSLENLLSFGKK